jgi:hypothetical protein
MRDWIAWKKYLVVDYHPAVSFHPSMPSLPVVNTSGIASILPIITEAKIAAQFCRPVSEHASLSPTGYPISRSLKGA